VGGKKFISLLQQQDLAWASKSPVQKSEASLAGSKAA